MSTPHDHATENDRAARAAHLRLMRGEPNELHVYFKPYRLEALSEMEDLAGWTLAWPERVPSSMTADQLVSWFAARSARVPYLIDKKAPTKSGRCEMTVWCPDPVTYLDEKGFVYCTKHGLQRRGSHRCRKLRPAEIKKVARGEVLAKY